MARSKIYKHGAVTPRTNMTPMIDVTFLIIIFFMLINNIVTDQTVPMIVPELDDPQTRRIDEPRKLIINLAPDERHEGDRRSRRQLQANPFVPGRQVPGTLKIGSVQYHLAGPGPHEVLFRNALESMVAQLRQAVTADRNIEVELRADCALHYDYVQQVLGAIGQAGVAKVHVVAHLPQNERPDEPSESSGPR